MAELLSILKQGNSNLQFEKEVLERRAEMAAQCECLAAWIEGRECICNKAVDVPLSTDALKKANSLIGEIEGCDQRIARVAAIKDDSASCAVELDAERVRYHQGGGGFYYEDRQGNYHSAPRVTVPKSLLIAALKEERIKLLIALQETGIVSVGNSNIKAVPK